jgi:hypothetical protein
MEQSVLRFGYIKVMFLKNQKNLTLNKNLYTN